MLESTRIKTEIPGPKSRALMERRHKAVSSGVGIATPMVAKEAKGALLTDVDGNTFIDFGGGIGVMNVGHTDSRVVEAVKEQAERLTHTCFYVTEYEGYIELAEKLNALVPGDAEKRSFFVNSGAEAVENAAKIARYYTGRPAVIAFENSFHGRTHVRDDPHGQDRPLQEGLRALRPRGLQGPGALRVPLPVRAGTVPAAAQGDCFASIERAFVSTVHPSSVAAIIVEPVSGEGGFIPFPDFYLRRLRELCDEHGIVLIVDEVQTGFGRTGKMLAIEHSGVEPDILTTAKSMGGGLPIAGVTGKTEIMDSVHVGGLGTTYGGNPIACAAALAVLEAFEEEDLLARANVLGERVMAAMREIQDRHPDFVGDVRGRGPMAAMEFVTDAESRTPDKERTAKVISGRPPGRAPAPERRPVRQLHPHPHALRHHRRGAGGGTGRPRTRRRRRSLKQGFRQQVSGIRADGVAHRPRSHRAACPGLSLQTALGQPSTSSTVGVRPGSAGRLQRLPATRLVSRR